MKSTALHATLLKVKAELDQFMTGLQEAGVLHAIQAYPNHFRPLFVADAVKPMTAGELLICLENFSTLTPFLNIYFSDNR